MGGYAYSGGRTKITYRLITPGNNTNHKLFDNLVVDFAILITYPLGYESD